MTDRPDADIAGATSAHARLLAALDSLAGGDPTGEWATRPSLLPGWTAGHVLSHLARNADSHVRMLGGAAGGEAVTQYEGGREARGAAIEAGTGRPAGDLVADVRSSSARLEQVWASFPDHAWDGHGFNSAGETWPCAAMPFSRWREVEVHLVDLGIGVTWSDWPDDYVARELPRALATLPGRLADGASRRRLTAWLLDRAPSPGELDIGGWEEKAGPTGR